MKRRIIKEYLELYPTYTTSELIDLLRNKEEVFADTKYNNLKSEINKTRRKLRYTFNGVGRNEPSVSNSAHSSAGLTETSLENVKDRSKYIEVRTNENIKTLDDLIRVCKIDTATWDVVKWECSVYEGQAKDPSGEIKINSFYRIKAFLKKKVELINLTDVKIEMMKELKSYSPHVKKISYSNKDTSKYLFEVNVFDLHFGKLSWDKEVGADYDIYIAEELYLNSIDSLIKKVSNLRDIEQIVFPIGNDFFNSDNKYNTTSMGTQQDEDTRWKKTFKKGRELLVKAIDTLYQIAPVSVVVVEGNHDTERSFYVGEALDCYYHNNKNVIVDNSPKARKYYKYGSCLIGYTHGNNEKISDLPLIMASEVPELWSATTHREWHLGHYHTKRDVKWLSTDEFKGVTVRFLSSLTAPDAWHYNKGFINNSRSAEAFLWHRDNGMEQHIFHTVTER